MSKRYLVLTAVGSDRRGLVKDISGEVHRAGCNLEDSRMAILAGEFALIVLLSGDAAAIGRIEAAAPVLERTLGLHLVFKTSEPAGERTAPAVWHLHVTGADQPGIVHGVGDVLARHRINIASLDSRVTPAAFSGTPVFHLRAELQLPQGLAVSDLRRELEHVCERLGMQLELDAGAAAAPLAPGPG